MKAILTTKFGPPEVLQLRKVPKPLPRKKEILVKVLATTVSSGDCRARSLNLSGVPFVKRVLARFVLGITKPRKPIQGLWLAGEVEKVGSSVKKFKNGDKVVARAPDLQLGAYAEYVALPEDGVIAPKPSNLGYEDAVAIPFGAVSALYFLRKGNIDSSQKLLINGASGAVGSAAVQLAKYFGADVTGICSSRNLDLVKSLGADLVIDYTKEEISECGKSFDVVFDSVGKLSLSNIDNISSKNCIFISVISSGHATPKIDNLRFVMKLAEQHKIRPVIDRVYSFEEMVEAHRYVEKGHKAGNVIVTIKPNK